MTNLDIIKYLANNNPARLAELLDDLYCNAWNCGSCVGSGGKVMKECEIDDFTDWLHEDATASGYYYDEELAEWRKAIGDLCDEHRSFYANVEECAADITPGVFVTGLCTSDDLISNVESSVSITGNAKCPHCGESYYTELFSTTTALYCPPIYKNGVNINKASNTTTTHCRCMSCNKEFTI